MLWSQTSSALTDGGWFNKFGPGVLLGAAVATVVTGAIAASYRQTLLRIVTDRRILHAAKLELDEAEQHIAQSGDSDTDLDLGAVWAATQRRLDYYHKIALSQSRNSFLFGQGAAIGGFIVLVLGAIVAAASRETTGAVVAGALGAVGAALSAFISATFAKSQESATKQLRDYFAQPLHLSKVLTAERLASQLPEDQRAPVIEVIVRAIFNERIEE